MKKIFLFLSLITFSVSIFSQGIAFEENHSLTDALAKAKKENKYVFIDAFATWCGPCKMMAAKIFPLKEVGDYYNAHFINLKLDMEAPENVEIAKKYEVKAYPTYLFLDVEGNVLHTACGGMDAKSFISMAQTALTPATEKNTIIEKVKNGDRSYATLQSYFQLQEKNGETVLKNQTLALEYFKALTDNEKLSDEAWSFFTQHIFSTDNDAFDFFVQNKKKYSEKFGEKAVTEFLTNRFRIGLLSNSFDEDEKKGNYSAPQPPKGGAVPR